MDIHHIRYFLAVCDTLNFTRAAERCNVTQPALSRAIQQLELDVGGLLFRREHNLTLLTDLGMVMRPRLAQIMDGLGDAKLEAKRFLTLEKATMTLGLMTTVGPRRFTGLIAELHAQHPGLSLKLVEGVPEELVEKLEEGELDVAIMASPGEFPVRFDHAPLYRERFLIAFYAGHRFEPMNAVPVTALDGENYLLRLHCEYKHHLSGLIRDSGGEMDVRFASKREDWVQTMVAAGMGICFIPEFSAVVPGLVTRPVIDPEVWRGVSLVTVAGRRHSPAVLAFVKAVKTYPWPHSSFA